MPEGPIDTLVFTCPAPAPTIPLILTSIASADDLSITAYLLADEPYVPQNWELTPDFAQETLRDGNGGTDYLARVEAATSAFGGQAFALEFAGPTADLEFADLIVDATVKQYPRLTRLRGNLSPWEMTLDPVFEPYPSLQDYDREHTIQILVDGSTRRSGGAWFLLGPLALLGIWRRRSR